MATLPTNHFWDTDAQEVSNITCLEDIENMDLSKMDFDDFRRKIPHGTTYEAVFAMIFHLVKTLQIKVKTLENELTDRVILDKTFDKP